MTIFPWFDARQFVPRPEYTCPTCRHEVTRSPAKAFALKDVVEAVASMMGDASPRTAAPAGSSPSGPWDSFFPRRSNM